MNIYSESGRNRRNWRVTLVFVVLSVLLVTEAAIVGISGNTTGIILCFAASVSLLLAFVYHWRDLWKYLILAISSSICIVMSILLHNLFYGIGVWLETQHGTAGSIMIRFCEILHVLFFLCAVFVFPAGLVIGIIGSVVISALYFTRKIHSKRMKSRFIRYHKESGEDSTKN